MPQGTVHPHARGADAAAVSPRCSTCGSSPRAWGRHGRTGADRAVGRFIPTRVGQTAIRPASSRLNSVHPHARGADGAAGTGIWTYSGSSPRAWGRRFSGLAGLGVRRFIPTRVGQTASRAANAIPRSVHPHARGADATCGAASSRGFGSSPRAWGRHAGCQRGGGRRRFIPTRVGQTSRGAIQVATSAVHPHARGAD